MIISSPESVFDLSEYGISIPLLSSRYNSVLSHLESHPRLGPLKHRWLEVLAAVAPSRQTLERVHTKAYLDVLLSNDPFEAVCETFELLNPESEPSFRYLAETATQPLSRLVDKALLHVPAMTATCARALETGFAHCLGGGFHHAMTFAGRGFCLANDIVIAARELQHTGKVRTVWVIDVDAHRGDGTAQITIDDPSILTLSIHVAHGWPMDESPVDKAGALKPWFFPSTLDIGVPEGQEYAYLELLQGGLRQLEVAASGKFPDLAIVVSGSDPFDLDILPSAKGLRLSSQQMFERDRLVYQWLNRRGIPQAYGMAGGYGPENWRVHAAFLESVLLERFA